MRQSAGGFEHYAVIWEHTVVNAPRGRVEDIRCGGTTKGGVLVVDNCDGLGRLPTGQELWRAFSAASGPDRDAAGFGSVLLAAAAGLVDAHRRFATAHLDTGDQELLNACKDLESHMITIDRHARDVLSTRPTHSAAVTHPENAGSIFSHLAWLYTRSFSAQGYPLGGLRCPERSQLAAGIRKYGALVVELEAGRRRLPVMDG